MNLTFMKFMRKSALIIAIAPIIFAINACNPNPGQTNNQGTQTSSNRWDAIQNRGQLICGVSGQIPGFSFVETDGEYSGIDVDICRAIASALFDDPDAVEYRNLTAQERFTALQTGEVDVLSRNTTWTLSRATSVGLTFAPVVFHDGQGIMVRKDSNINSLADMANKAICVQSGTTTEQNLADQMRKRNITYTPIVFEDVNITFATFAEGRCDGITADRSALVSRGITLPNPENNIILDEVISAEPLAPAVAKGDPVLADAVTWVVYALIKAEELGINSENVGEFADSEDPDIKRFLGTEGDLGEGLGLSNDFAERIVRHVGNYAEIYDRNLGPDTELNLSRGENQLGRDGGLLYSPPFR